MIASTPPRRLRRVCVPMMGLLLLCLSSGPRPAWSDTITVDTTDGTGAADGDCSLIEAMQAAETDAVFGDCPAGNGRDRILLAVTGTIVPTSDLPSVAESVSFVGPGADELSIDGEDAVRLFYLGALDGLQEFVLSGLTITRGASTTSGGAIAVRRRNWLTVTECKVTDSYSPSGGGGIAVDNNTSSSPDWPSILIERTQISGNTADGSSGGGGVRVGIRNIVRIVDSTIADNTLTHMNGNGGGINAFFSTGGGQLQLVRSTITGNNARDGAGLALNGPSSPLTSPLDIAHSTIVDNTASRDGGGVDASNVVLTLNNSIVALNSALTSGPDVKLSTSTVFVLEPNFVSDNSSVTTEFPDGTPTINGSYVGTSSSPLDPNLDTLADNGGWTETMMLVQPSDAIDTGSCIGEVRDQRGYAGSSTRATSGGCDMGAVEFNATDLQPVFLSNFESGTVHRWR